MAWSQRVHVRRSNLVMCTMVTVMALVCLQMPWLIRMILRVPGPSGSRLSSETADIPISKPPTGTEVQSAPCPPPPASEDGIDQEWIQWLMRPARPWDGDRDVQMGIASHLHIFMIPHPDDWFLFMGPEMMAIIGQSDQLAILVYLSAGDAGNGVRMPQPPYTAPQYLVRELASMNALHFLHSALIGPIRPYQYRLHDHQVELGHHLVLQRHFSNVVSYYFRLPDGGMSGQGFEETHSESLGKAFHLVHDHSSSSPSSSSLSDSDEVAKGLTQVRLSAIDDSTSYDDWSQLVEAIELALLRHCHPNSNVTVHSFQGAHDAARNDHDHPDHHYSALLMQDVMDLLMQHLDNGYTYRQYLGYDVKDREPNLDRDAYELALGMLAVSSATSARFGYPVLYDPLHKSFARARMVTHRHVAAPVLPPA